MANTYTTRAIGIAELRQLGMAQSDCADRGWAVVEHDGDIQTVIEWYTDRHAADDEAQRLTAAEDE